MNSIRFHWSQPTFESSRGDFIRLCHEAENAGLESIHVPGGGSLTDALAMALAAGKGTSRIRFRIGWDAAGVLATLTGRELIETWEALNGRLIVHMILGNSEPRTNGHPARAGDFLDNCRELFPNGSAPAFDVEGETADAAFLAIKHADCLWRLPCRPQQVYADALPVLHFGKDVGLHCAAIARETRDQALEAAARLSPQLEDKTSWVTPNLWIGKLAGWSDSIAVFAGTSEEIARELFVFKKNSIYQFMIRSWPDNLELSNFCARVIPLVRALEKETCGA